MIVCLQVGNVHSGAFDPLAEAIDIVRTHDASRDAWVHIDGAFGLWAAASPAYRGLVAGLERADSWTTDAHKTLNVPYDNGLAIVADAPALYASLGMHAAYLIQDDRPDPFASVPEFSRRARGFTVWAALRTLGRRGIADMVERFCGHARRFADQLAAIDGVEIVNEVVFTQVCVSFGPDEVTREVAARLLADGTAWMTPSTWHGRAVLRISVSNWRTTDDDVDRTVAAVRRVLAEVRGAASAAGRAVASRASARTPASTGHRLPVPVVPEHRLGGGGDGDSHLGAVPVQPTGPDVEEDGWQQEQDDRRRRSRK